MFTAIAGQAGEAIILKSIKISEANPERAAAEREFFAEAIKSQHPFRRINQDLIPVPFGLFCTAPNT
jgi:hypothetical protein